MYDKFKDYTEPENFAKIVDYGTVGEMWAYVSKQFAQNTAIVYGEKTYTFAELDSDVAHYRAFLLSQGVKKGDCVGMLLPNSYAFAKVFLALTTLGAVAAVLPPQLPAEAVFGCAMKFGMKALVYAPGLAEKTAILQKMNPSCLLLDSDAAFDGTAPAGDVQAEDPCTIMFTGGTSGKSKGALLSHQAVMAGTRNGCYGVNPAFEQRYVLVLPLSHVFGLIRNLMTSLYSGSGLFICQDTKDMFRDIAMFKPTIMVLVPALAEMALTLSKQFGRNMLGNDLKYIICGAAPVPQYLVREYHAMGVQMAPGYGLTESANLVSGNPDAMGHPDSVGIPYAGQEIKFVDGEIWLKGINMMESYVGEPEENAEAYEDGWFKTGDLGRLDEDGFLYITGRKKAILVLPSGENVSPEEVEACFNAIDLVQDSLVYCDENGALVLEVVPRKTEMAKVEGDAGKLLQEQIAQANSTLPSIKRVSRVVIREEDFKRSPSMKILRDQK